MIVAVDSGEYCTGMIQEIGSRMTAGELKGIRIIASCDAAASEAAFVGVPQAMSADASKVSSFCLASLACFFFYGEDVVYQTCVYKLKWLELSVD